MCAQFLELPFLKCNENVVFLVKNTYNKGKGSFLFESDIFLGFFGGCPGKGM